MLSPGLGATGKWEEAVVRNLESAEMGPEHAFPILALPWGSGHSVGRGTGAPRTETGCGSDPNSFTYQLRVFW